MKRLEQLTFTRFIIIILVLFAHDTTGPYLRPLLFFPLTALIRSGSTGVSYLFIMSGFVMALVYFRPEKKFDFLTFWRTRFIRLYPLYILAFLLTCVYYYDAFLVVKPQKILANIFIIQAWIPAYAQSFNFVAWSMAVEIFFYFFFPFFVLWAYPQSTRKLIWFAVIVWAVNMAIYHILWIGYITTNRELVLYFPPLYFGSFVMGVVGGIWYLRIGRDENLSSGKRFAVLAISFLLLAVYTIISTDFIPVLPHLIQPITGFLAPLLILFIVALSLDQSIISRFLSHPKLVNLGELSYALYILHIPVLWLYKQALKAAGVADVQNILNLTFLPLILLVAFVTHWYIDTPIRKWMKEFFDTIHLRALLLDFAIFIPVAFFIFQIRFSEREYRLLYREMERLVFWTAFFARPLFSLILGTYSPKVMLKPGYQWALRAILAVTLGSIAMASSAYIGYRTGWFENFPRSIFVTDWLIVLPLSLAARYAFRLFSKPKAAPLPA
ncbi:hypothetical protein MASR2M66_09050 [Chloroflexota bacterium]